MVTRRFLFSALLAAAAFAHMHTAAAQTFPLLGGYLEGGSTRGLTPAHVAPLDVVILGAYVGWTNNAGLNAGQFAAAAKAINPNLKAFIYTEISDDTNPPSRMNEGNSLIASVPWWALSNGSLVTSDFSGYYTINITAYSNVYNGQNYTKWRAGQDHSKFLSPNPDVDGLYIDNFYPQPPVTADFTHSGSPQSPSANASIWRQGFVAYVNNLRAASPASQQLVIGNIAEWNVGTAITEYVSPSPVLNGGVMEDIIGRSYSIESQSVGWAGMMAFYTHVMASMAAPKLVIFQQYATTNTDYRGFRYGFTSCLMENGYYYYNSSNNNDYATFDEFSANLGTATTPALVFPGATPYQNGVYRRDFANGIALVNPKGNGARTVTLETSYKHLSGTQDPTVNNGQTVTSVTLQDRDGVILLRTTPQAVPAAPTLTVQ